MIEAMLIARWCPGFGDPFQLTLGQWNGALTRIQDWIQLESATDADSATKAQLDVTLRRARRDKARESNGSRRSW